MKPNLQPVDQVHEAMESKPEGLTGQDVADCIVWHNPDKLSRGKMAPLLRRRLKELADPMIML